MDDRTTIAAMAMQGLLANSRRAFEDWTRYEFAEEARLAADALLAELAKTKPVEVKPAPMRCWRGHFAQSVDRLRRRHDGRYEFVYRDGGTMLSHDWSDSMVDTAVTNGNLHPCTDAPESQPAPAKAGPSPAFEAMREALVSAQSQFRYLEEQGDVAKLYRNADSEVASRITEITNALALADKEHPRA